MPASASASPRPDTPRDVKLAVALFVAALIVGILDFASQRVGVTSVQSEALSSPVSLVLGIVIAAGFLALIMTRQNWGRILFAGLTVLGLLLTIPVIVDELGADPLGAGFSLLQVALQVAGLIFLFRPNSNAWFRSA